MGTKRDPGHASRSDAGGAGAFGRHGSHRLHSHFRQFASHVDHRLHHHSHVSFRCARLPAAACFADGTHDAWPVYPRLSDGSTRAVTGGAVTAERVAT